MYLLALLFPLINCLFMLLGGRILTKYNFEIIMIWNMVLSIFFSVFMVYEVIICETSCSMNFGSWFKIGVLDVSWLFYFDKLVATMFLVVTVVSTCVHVFSLEYMGEDPHLKRFMAYLSLFTFFMLVLVSSGNLLQLFLGWEGIGLASYLLINFWYQRTAANKSALKAMILNRIGDFGISLGLFLIFASFRNLDYSTIAQGSYFSQNSFVVTSHLNEPLLKIACVFLFLGCVGKSAQIGLHVWLPDAMEGPTPVSALIHAATLVTAGIFLIARLSFFFEQAFPATLFMTVFGCITITVAGLTGLIQNDIKRVIAYSTCSQLGYMVFVAGLTGFSCSMYHMCMHAFFKALLFLGAGAIIHPMWDEQDMRKYSGLHNMITLSAVSILLATFALIGFPFSTGFYSKDLILETGDTYWTSVADFAVGLAIVSVGSTVLYSIRTFILTFGAEPKTSKPVKLFENGWKVYIPIILLNTTSTLVGYYSWEILVGLGFYKDTPEDQAKFFSMFDSEYLPETEKLFPLLVLTILFYYAVIFFNEGYFKATILYLKTSKFVKFFYTFFNRKWFFDKVYNDTFSQALSKIAYEYTYRDVDRGMLEFLGPRGIGLVFFVFISRITGIRFETIIKIAGAFFTCMSLFTVYNIYLALFKGTGIFVSLFFFVMSSPTKNFLKNDQENVLSFYKRNSFFLRQVFRLFFWVFSQVIFVFFCYQLDFSFLLILILVSLIGIFFNIFFYFQSFQWLYQVSCYISSLNVFISLIMFYLKTQFASSFFSHHQYYSFFNTTALDSFIGIDGISLWLIFLTNVFIFLSILSLDPNKTKKLNLLLICIFLLQWAVLSSFSIQEFFGFFIVFETTLLPIYYLVLEWGSRARKVRAGYLISIYTFFGSIFMLFSVLYLYSKTNLSYQNFLIVLDFYVVDQINFWTLFFVALAAKIPTFPLHIWLPEAHVEAPTIGSVLLAALLLKLGTYGLIRFVLLFFPLGNFYSSGVVSTLAILSILYTSLTAIRQVDLKKVIAYSSVGHMNVILLGILVLGLENLEGAIFQKISHGIVSGALFFSIGSFYRRYKVRSLKYLGGLMQISPLLAVIFLIFSMANISFPGTSSFIGEFVIFFGLFPQNAWLVFLAAINIITGAIYMLFALNRLVFGNLKNLHLKYSFDLNRSELYLFVILLYCLIFLGLKPNYIFNMIHWDSINIIEHLRLYVSNSLIY